MNSKINNIQVLRFFSIFSVMLAHLPLFGFGAWGVDFFFVISGFMMMYITEDSYTHFLTKRFIRVVPLYWILTMFVFSIAVFKPDFLNSTTANFEHLFKSFFFIPFDKNGTGHSPILFLGWTLNFEILYYILFSLSMWIFKKNRIYICSFAIVLVFLVSSFYSEKHFILKTYSDSIILEFIYGMIIFEFYKKKNINDENKFQIKSNDIIIVFFLFFLSSIFIYFNFPRVLSYGFLGTSLLYFILIFVNNNFFSKVFVVLGDACFSIYLIHPYVIQFFYKFFKLNNTDLSDNLLATFLSITVTLFLSILIYRTIERPLNHKIKGYLKLK